MNEVDLHELASVFKGDVSPEALAAWLGQFELEDQPYAIALVKAFRYYSAADILVLLRKLYGLLTEDWKVDPGATLFIPCGYVAKSGDAVAYFFKHENELSDSSFLRSSDLTESHLLERRTVVFLDDFIGSGELLVHTAQQIVKPLSSRLQGVRFIFAAMTGYARGIRRVHDSDGVSVCVAERFEDELEPFGDKSTIFPDPATRSRAESAVRKYTQVLSPTKPLGYGSTQGLVGFFFGTPNNTLPIFWRSSADWRPLLPRGVAIHDPRRMVEVPRSLTGSTAYLDGGETVVIDELGKEATRALFDEFQTMACMEAAARAFAHAGLGEEALVSVVSAIRALADRKHEGKPVASALLLGTRHRLAARVEQAFVTFDPPIPTSDLKTVGTAAELIDGAEGALLVDETACVRGAGLYGDDQRGVDDMLPERFAGAAATAWAVDGCAVVFTGLGGVTIIDRGIRILTRREGAWHHQGRLAGLRALEVEHGLHDGLLQGALKAALALADAGWGAMLTLGDSPHVEALAGRRSPASFCWRDISLSSGSLRPLIFAARQDGATVLDETGRLCCTMTHLYPPASAVIEEEGDRGTRHSNAARISKATGALTIAVSVDSTITLYSKGRRTLRITG